MTGTAQSIILTARPVGHPTLANFQLVDHPAPEPAEGEFLVRVLWLSLDPYMRALMEAPTPYAPAVEVGGPMIGGAVAVVTVSRHPGFAAGDHVVGFFGWTTHAVSDGSDVHLIDPETAPLTAHLGVLGLPGHTAWISLNRIAKAQPGETILISAASGAVGSVLGQLARVRGLTTIGMAGGSAKCAYATEELGYDACIDHRSEDFAAQLAEACPNGIDVYFENVGGKVLYAVLPLLNPFARVPVCGVVSWYNLPGLPEGPDHGPQIMSTILKMKVKMQGFIIYASFPPSTYAEFLHDMTAWLAEGAIKYREHRVEGLEAAPAALNDLLVGRNFGKVVVRVG